MLNTRFMINLQADIRRPGCLSARAHTRYNNVVRRRLPNCYNFETLGFRKRDKRDSLWRTQCRAYPGRRPEEYTRTPRYSIIHWPRPVPPRGYILFIYRAIPVRSTILDAAVRFLIPLRFFFFYTFFHDFFSRIHVHLYYFFNRFSFSFFWSFYDPFHDLFFLFSRREFKYRNLPTRLLRHH